MRFHRIAPGDQPVVVGKTRRIAQPLDESVEPAHASLVVAERHTELLSAQLDDHAGLRSNLFHCRLIAHRCSCGADIAPVHPIRGGTRCASGSSGTT
jgi:hypothetical protein